MDEYIFDIYCEWRKKQNGKLFEKIKKFPKSTIISFFVCILGVFFPLFLIININNLKAWQITSFTILEILCCIIMNSLAQKIKTTNSKKRYTNYINYCFSLKKELLIALNDLGQSDTYIITLKKAVDKKIEKMQNSYDNIFNRIDTLFKILLIPVLLAIIAGVSKGKTPIADIITISLLFTIIIFLLYISILGIARFLGLIIEDEIQRYKDFATDLNSILDIKTLNNSNTRNYIIKKNPAGNYKVLIKKKGLECRIL